MVVKMVSIIAVAIAIEMDNATIPTAIVFLTRYRENEATGMYSRHIRIAHWAATQSKIQMRSVFLIKN
jgi:hypothetical protein